MVQLALSIETSDVPCKGKSQVSDKAARASPAINTEQKLGLEMICGFFQGFAHHAFKQGFICFQMPGWLVLYRAFIRELLDQ